MKHTYLLQLKRKTLEIKPSLFVDMLIDFQPLDKEVDLDKEMDPHPQLSFLLFQ